MPREILISVTDSALEKFNDFVASTDGVEILRTQIDVPDLGSRAHNQLIKLDQTTITLSQLTYFRFQYGGRHVEPVKPPQEWIDFVQTLKRSEKSLMTRSFGKLLDKHGDHNLVEVQKQWVQMRYVVYGTSRIFLEKALGI